MAKKVRRVRKSRPRTQKTNNTAAEQTSTAPATKTRPSSAERFQHEYAYVLKDLRQILVLAGIMFILLIVLNIVLQ